jgi:hypothetical protein
MNLICHQSRNEEKCGVIPAETLQLGLKGTALGQNEGNLFGLLLFCR